MHPEGRSAQQPDKSLKWAPKGAIGTTYVIEITSTRISASLLTIYYYNNEVHNLNTAAWASPAAQQAPMGATGTMAVCCAKVKKEEHV